MLTLGGYNEGKREISRSRVDVFSSTKGKRMSGLVKVSWQSGRVDIRSGDKLLGAIRTSEPLFP